MGEFIGALNLVIISALLITTFLKFFRDFSYGDLKLYIRNANINEDFELDLSDIKSNLILDFSGSKIASLKNISKSLKNAKKVSRINLTFDDMDVTSFDDLSDVF